MIPELEEAGYTVKHVSGGPMTDEEIQAANLNGTFFEGQSDIPEGVSVVPMHDKPLIVEAAGYDVRRTLYADDSESIEELLRIASPEPDEEPAEN